MRRLLASVFVVTAALAASVVAAGGVTDRGSETVDEFVDVRVTAARQLSLAGLAIGDRREGVVEVTNAGSGSAALVMEPNLTGGGELVRQLQVSVFDASPGAGRAPVYDGPLATLGSLEVAELAAGERRRYAIVIRFHSTGTRDGDNALQGLTARLTLVWSGVSSSAR